MEFTEEQVKRWMKEIGYGARRVEMPLGYLYAVQDDRVHGYDNWFRRFAVTLDGRVLYPGV